MLSARTATTSDVIAPNRGLSPLTHDWMSLTQILSSRPTSASSSASETAVAIAIKPPMLSLVLILGNP